MDNKVQGLFDLHQFYGTKHVATLQWQKPYLIARYLKRMEEISGKHPKGTYFKIVPNKVPQCF